MRKRIAVIPIDNRPVCYNLLEQISSLDKTNEILLPDISLLGDLTKMADIEGLFNWLETLENIDCMIISLDTIAYGGLIASRRCSDEFDVIKTRVDKLCSVLKKISSRVYAFSSIMRISNNNYNEEEKEYWAKYGKRIFEYSYNLHKMEKNCAGENMLACNCASTRIPEDILQDYLKTRERNFKINTYYIELANSGLFDTLVFSKDDCAQYGLNIKEAEKLSKLSEQNKNIFIKTGADEIPLTLLSRAINKEKHIKIAPKYTNPSAINKISKYEDITVQESVISQIELAGGIVSDIENCDVELLVNNFSNEQGELVMGVDVPLYDGELHLPDKPYFISDIVNANGADNNFVKQLLDEPSLKEFYGYSAWNTTGNTLGCAIASALTYCCAKQPDKVAFQLLQLTRFLDDWAYQANVRSQINDKIENLSNDSLKAAMVIYEKKLLNKFQIKNVEIRYKFPWKRFFELEVDLKKRYVTVPFVDILFCE